MPTTKLATEILKREYAKAVVGLALNRAQEIEQAKTAGFGSGGKGLANVINWFAGAAKPTAQAVETATGAAKPVANAAAAVADAAPAAKVVAPVVEGAKPPPLPGTAARRARPKPPSPPPVPPANPAAAAAAQTATQAPTGSRGRGVRLPSHPLVSEAQRQALRNAKTVAERNKILYNSPEGPNAGIRRWSDIVTPADAAPTPPVKSVTPSKPATPAPAPTKPAAPVVPEKVAPSAVEAMPQRPKGMSAADYDQMLVDQHGYIRNENGVPHPPSHYRDMPGAIPSTPLPPVKPTAAAGAGSPPIGAAAEGLPGGGGRGALIPTGKPGAGAPLAGELVPGGRVPAPWRRPTVTIDGKVEGAGGWGARANDLFNKYRSLTGLNGGVPALIGTSAAYGGALAVDKNLGTNFTSGPQSLTPTGVVGSVMFPVQTAAGLASSVTNAGMDAVLGSAQTPQAKLDEFLAANNIQTAADVDKLSPAAQQQFDTLIAATTGQPAPQAAPQQPKFDTAAGDALFPQSSPMGPDQPAATGAGAQNQQQAAQTAQQPKPQLTPEQQTAAFTSAEAKLKTTADPKAREAIIQDLARNMPNLDDTAAAGAAAVLNGDINSPAAKNFIDTHLGPAGDEFLRQQTGGNTSDPTIFGQARGMWDSLGTAGQIAFAIGVPLTLLGVLGGSGIGTLLGMLGLGVAGFSAAQGGLFGEAAQGAATGASDAMTAAVGGNAAPVEQIPFEYTPENATQFLTQLSNTNTDTWDNMGRGNPNSLKAFAGSNKPALEALLARPTEELRGLYSGLDAATQKNLAARLQLMRGRVSDNPQTPDINEAQQAQQKIDEILKAGAFKVTAKTAAISAMQKAARCWSGYEPVPGKKPYSEDSCRPIGSKKKKKTEKKAATPAWQRSAGKSEEGGLNAKGRASYHRETGGTLKAPVTESNPKGERAKRQNSFCSRMCGMKRVNTGSDAKKDPDSRINKSLRKWNCKCSSAMAFGEKLAQLEKIAVNPPCPGGVCPAPRPAPAPTPPPQYSKTPFDRAYAEAAFKQHNIPYNATATDQQLYNLYTRKGTVKPGQKMTPFQATVGARHNYLPPAPLQPQ